MMRSVKPHPNRKLLALWHRLDVTLRRRFADLAKTTVGSLRQYAEGRRNMSPGLAIRVEKATVMLGVPKIDRTELSEVCRKCKYARACRKGKP